MNMLSKDISQLLTQDQMVRCRVRSMHTLLLVCVAFIFTSCAMEPPLHTVDEEQEIVTDMSTVISDISVLWDYDLEYNWQAEWQYGWDNLDTEIFGEWEITAPMHFNIRRYYTGEIPDAPHTTVISDYVSSLSYRASYKLGYYDLMIWNDVQTLDGVQSLHYDETTSLEYITAYTNQSMLSTKAPNRAAMAASYDVNYAFYQPEFLFAGSYDNLHVTNNPDDYDYVIDNIWYKHIPLDMTPVTYIYMPQIFLHNNNKITQIDGSGNLTGMARSVNLKTHITSNDAISVNHTLRMKRNVEYTRKDGTKENVDIIGGRAFTFGLTGCDPYHITRSGMSYKKVQDSQVRNYLELKIYFNNGTDSTMVFDVTDQIKERYKGGLINIHLDCDTVPLPSRSGGSGFDAVVKDFNEVVVPDIPL